MQRIATLLLALAASTDSSSLRGTTEGEERSLFGTEFGLEGMKALFSDVGFGVQDHSGSTPDTDPDFIGKQIFFEPQPQPLDDPSTTASNAYSTRIVGGSNSPEQRNYAMHLRYQSSDGKYYFAGCGGTLISPCHVLTAAHCCANARAGLPEYLYINALNPFQGNLGNDFHFSSVAQTIVHNGFDDTNNSNDVAVLVLATCVDITEFPVMKLATQAYLDGLNQGTLLAVSGFGKVAESDDALVENLQKVQVPLINRNNCNTNYPGRVLEDMICAGRSEGGQDSCQGDSGGPLFIDESNSNGAQTQIGIVSWGSGCAQPNKPGVYASVAYHYDFIQKSVCDHPDVDAADVALCIGFNLPPTPAPVATQFPTAQPSRGCGELNDGCLSNSQCCDEFICLPRDRKCIDPSYGKTEKVRLSDGRRRRDGN